MTDTITISGTEHRLINKFDWSADTLTIWCGDTCIASWTGQMELNMDNAALSRSQKSAFLESAPLTARARDLWLSHQEVT